MDGLLVEPEKKRMSSRKKQVLAYTIVLAVCYVSFWLFAGGTGAMGYSVLVQFFTLPLASFVVALLMGLDKSWKERQWWLLLYFGFGYFLMQYGTFSLANMISAGKFNSPLWDLELLLMGAAYALPGMALGSVIRWGREFASHPGHRCRPLWAFGMVWGVCVTVQLGLIWLPTVLLFPGLFLPLVGLPAFPSETVTNGILAASHLAYWAGNWVAAQVCAFAAALLVGRSPQWTGREKARLLPLFGAAGALSLGLAASQGALGGAMELEVWAALLLLPLGYLAGQVLPAIGLGMGALLGRKNSPVDKPLS